MRELVEAKTLSGKFSAHCGLCWSPVFRLWVADEAPDYTACPLGDYTPQTCPNEVAGARMTADLTRLMAGVKPPPQPDEAREGSQSQEGDDANGTTPNPSFSKAEGRTP